MNFSQELENCSWILKMFTNSKKCSRILKMFADLENVMKFKKNP